MFVPYYRSQYCCWYCGRSVHTNKFVRATGARHHLGSKPRQSLIVTRRGRRRPLGDSGRQVQVLGTSCAILRIEELDALVAMARKAVSPPSELGFRWTRGIACWVSGKPCTVTLKPTAHGVFFPINRHAVGAFNHGPVSMVIRGYIGCSGGSRFVKFSNQPDNSGFGLIARGIDRSLCDWQYAQLAL